MYRKVKKTATTTTTERCKYMEKSNHCLIHHGACVRFLVRNEKIRIGIFAASAAAYLMPIVANAIASLVLHNTHTQ